MPANQQRTSEKPPQRAVDIARSESAKQNGVSLWFSNFAAKASATMGSPVTFLLAILLIVVWGATGPIYHYSDTWQLVINTGTTIITFLMVFLIQNTQNRDAKAIHLKLNELIHAGRHAHNELIDVEKLSDEELKALDDYYIRIREECERRNARAAKPNGRTKKSA
jgi:low affinity Fe/Cu permease